MKKVGVEPALSNVRQYLEDNNISVQILEGNNKNPKDLDKLDAIVVTGADENLMGIHDIVSKTRIINADGKTAEEVYDEIIHRISQ